MNKQYTLPYSLMKYFAFAVYDFDIMINVDLTSTQTVKSNLQFSTSNQYKTLLIIFGASAIIVCLFLAKVILQISQEKQGKLNKIIQSSQEQQINCMCITHYIQSRIIFPSAMSFVVIFPLISGSNNQSANIPFLSLLILPQTVFLSIIFFCQWKNIFVKQSFSIDDIYLYKCRSKYVPIYLSFVLVVSILFQIAAENLSFWAEAYILGVYCLAFIMFVIARPYQRTIDNLGVLLNLLSVTMFLLWSVLKSAGFFREQFYEILICIILIVTLIALTVISISRIIIHIRQRFIRDSSNKVMHSISKPKKIKKEQSRNYQDQYINNSTAMSFLATPLIDQLKMSKLTTPLSKFTAKIKNKRIIQKQTGNWEDEIINQAFRKQQEKKSIFQLTL